MMGHEIKITPKSENVEMDNAQKPFTSIVNDEYIKNLGSVLTKYTNGKKKLEEKIIENDEWYRMQHWDLIRGKGKSKDDPEPVTGYLFSTLSNKHADMMDYYPQPNFIERHQDDLKEAEMLDSIMPMILDQINFRKTYSDAAWYYLKQGFVIYGSFWNTELENGLGNLDYQKLDALNVYWEPKITDIQKSRKLFITSAMDDDLIHETWPITKDRITEMKSIEIPRYKNDPSTDGMDGKSVIIDCYEKMKNSEGKQVVHLTKFVGGIPLESTLDDPETVETGLYDHGMYPVEIDVLFPEEDSPVGFGFIDIVKNPQMYIDKLDQIISKNALISGKMRYLTKRGGGISAEDLSDLSKDVIECEASVRLNEDYAIVQGKPMDGFIVNHRQNKIGELKDTSNTTDFSRGNSSGGVTAMGAIYALQEAGNKVSRDMVGGNYNTYSRLIYQGVELLRQFYDQARMYRIEPKPGEVQYIEYSNEGLKPKELPAAYDGEGMIEDAENHGQMMMDPEYKPKTRKPTFDIKVKAEKANPFSRMAQNELALNFFKLGFFNPEQAPAAMIALEMMYVEGKDKIMAQIAKNGDLAIKLQQTMQMLEQLKAQNAQSQTIIAGLAHMIKEKTGVDVMSAPQGQVQTIPQDNGGQVV